MALAPTTDSALTGELQSAVITRCRTRRHELRAIDAALGHEIEHLDGAVEAVTSVTDWLVDTNETPLTDLGFDALRTRHEALATHRERCEEVAVERQAFLRRTTSWNAQAGVSHRRLVERLYRAFPVDFPVLATVVRLEDVCADCQRIVRDHLTRRA